jgi:outer membrane lipoprotein carrier protein
VTRVWVCLGLLAAAAPAATPELDTATLLKRIEERYNHAKTLQVHFTEGYLAQGQARKPESGTLTLRKPGRMRWDYAQPAGKLFVSDGRNVWLYTPSMKKVEKVPLTESEDMRAPLAFLLGKLDFLREFRNFSVRPVPGGGWNISAAAQSDRLPYDKIDMTVASDFSITNLSITGADKSILTFGFTGERVNPPVDNSQFRFVMPEGATLATEEAINR